MLLHSIDDDSLPAIPPFLYFFSSETIALDHRQYNTTTVIVVLFAYPTRLEVSEVVVTLDINRRIRILYSSFMYMVDDASV